MKYKAVARVTEKQRFEDFSGDDEQLKQIIESMRRHRDRIAELQEEKKSLQEDLKGELEEEERLVKQLTKGKLVTVECEEQYVGDLNLVRVVRKDTGEVEFTRQAFEQDLQGCTDDVEIEVEIPDDQEGFPAPEQNADESTDAVCESCEKALGDEEGNLTEDGVYLCDDCWTEAQNAARKMQESEGNEQESAGEAEGSDEQAE